MQNMHRKEVKLVIILYLCWGTVVCALLCIGVDGIRDDDNILWLIIKYLLCFGLYLYCNQVELYVLPGRSLYARADRSKSKSCYVCWRRWIITQLRVSKTMRGPNILFIILWKEDYCNLGLIAYYLNGQHTILVAFSIACPFYSTLNVIREWLLCQSLSQLRNKLSKLLKVIVVQAMMHRVTYF